jgi:hypothetical protein
VQTIGDSCGGVETYIDEKRARKAYMYVVKSHTYLKKRKQEMQNIHVMSDSQLNQALG